MRLDRWPLERIMCLPDWCFGRRWSTGLYATSAATDPLWDISEQSLPQACVLWEVVFWSCISNVGGDYFRLALGFQLPTSLAMMNALDPLLPGVGVPGPEPRNIIGLSNGFGIRFTMRQMIQANGRKVVLEVNPFAVANKEVQVIMVFSSIPREVPDWLVSAQAINLP